MEKNENVRKEGPKIYLPKIIKNKKYQKSKPQNIYTAVQIEAPNFGLHATNCIANISSTAALISSDNVANGAMV